MSRWVAVSPLGRDGDERGDEADHRRDHPDHGHLAAVGGLALASDCYLLMLSLIGITIATIVIPR